MNFQRGRMREEPEINLIPMIDILLVILIFLMVTTTYSKYTGLEINLPTADAEQKTEQANEINVVVNHQGEVMVNRNVVAGRDVEAISLALRRVAEANGAQEPVVIISADAEATHQSVIDVMQAAQQAGLAHISFATQNAGN
ncbi:Biopolymer transport protein ExbD/TolR [Sterolibacterium denitrificans]|uniref:Biopolymer transporter ExbD n=2 Tax=Sterolibacterium denitrificans TaxID=157592 RepID=A0A656Z9Z7_9PROT|nr:biopolymer transporter ExbD [Sterolibacterium denitrificans]KYC29425.1 biopolymer transporter ExbD [Sterolibacterium denitrificans]SMB31445.1 Biopolymer transport protein ExbD/TolR [Sterolibacterium denitrificans]